MKLTKLTEKEFKIYADKHPLITFHQTKEWADLKKKNGWESYYLGIKNEKDKLQAAALILAKKIPLLHKKIFYSPRGLLIDYNDKELLEEFVSLDVF